MIRKIPDWTEKMELLLDILHFLSEVLSFLYAVSLLHILLRKKNYPLYVVGFEIYQEANSLEIGGKWLKSRPSRKQAFYQCSSAMTEKVPSPLVKITANAY
jgi:hypothetical protein